MHQHNILRKRLLYQSQHRGMKEMDILLGGFAEKALHHMTPEELVKFEELLAFPDQELYGWFFEQAPISENVSRDLIEQINAFINR